MRDGLIELNKIPEKINTTPLIVSVDLPEDRESINRENYKLGIWDTDHLDDSVDFSNIIDKRKPNEKDDEYLKRIFTSDLEIEKLKNYLSDQSKNYKRPIMLENKYLKIEVDYTGEVTVIKKKTDEKNKWPQA